MASWRGWRAWLAEHLPWYDVARERQREVRSDRTVRKAEVARLRAERVIAEYREAEKVSAHAAERVIEEARRADDQ